tara:strand:- start:1340 stop:1729 length:390 start_codon:yes stop_codon:yes gene_type:complete
MKKLTLKKKAQGFALSSELIFLSTIVTAGLSVGMVSVRDAVVSEMSDVGQAIGSLNQSYAFNGIVNAASTSEVEGSGYSDKIDAKAGDGEVWTFIVAGATEATLTTATGGGTVGVESFGTLVTTGGGTL